MLSARVTLAHQVLGQGDVVELEVVGPHLQVLRLGPVHKPAGHHGVTGPSLGQSRGGQEEEAESEISDHCEGEQGD